MPCRALARTLSCPPAPDSLFATENTPHGIDLGLAHRPCNEIRAPKAAITVDYMGPSRTNGYQRILDYAKKGGYPCYSPGEDDEIRLWAPMTQAGVNRLAEQDQ